MVKKLFFVLSLKEPPHEQISYPSHGKPWLGIEIAIVYAVDDFQHLLVIQIYHFHSTRIQPPNRISIGVPMI